MSGRVPLRRGWRLRGGEARKLPQLRGSVGRGKRAAPSSCRLRNTAADGGRRASARCPPGCRYTAPSGSPPRSACCPVHVVLDVAGGISIGSVVRWRPTCPHRSSSIITPAVRHNAGGCTSSVLGRAVTGDKPPPQPPGCGRCSPGLDGRPDAGADQSHGAPILRSCGVCWGRCDACSVAAARLRSARTCRGRPSGRRAPREREHRAAGPRRAGRGSRGVSRAATDRPRRCRFR
jgi:hypothetical protein